MVPANWRKYDDWHGCIEDHAEFLINNKRYAPAFEQPAPGEGENAAPAGERFAQAVAAAGYATDPDYAQKIIQIMRAHDLHTLDLA
jgi:flagellum-specific peptidoglycan hydrolase FlgJ